MSWLGGLFALLVDIARLLTGRLLRKTDPKTQLAVESKKRREAENRLTAIEIANRAEAEVPKKVRENRKPSASREKLSLKDWSRGGPK